MGTAKRKNGELLPPEAPTSCKEIQIFIYLADNLLYAILCMNVYLRKESACLVNRGYHQNLVISLTFMPLFVRIQVSLEVSQLVYARHSN